ncbi:hypothetical protein FBU30_002359 [Linnemannia zychae]|nr:hypothetical protein FBU30_002359 [Linnemannia zychae]
MALFTGWQVLEPIELKFSPSATPSTSQELPVDENIRSDNGSSGTKSTTKQHSFSNRSFNPPALSRTASDPSNRFIAPASPSWNDFSGSLSDSQETNQMNWSPKKPLSTPSSRLPAVFGTYRDSSKRTSQDESFIHGMSRLGQDSSSIYTSTFSSSNHDRTNDNKFRARAYEPSPLANPSLITNMSISNISFGEMLGFPSAKFQQPENHFAHRSAPDSNKLEPWALRKPAGTGSGAFGMDRGIHRRGQGSRPSGLSRNADDENERDDEDEDYSYTQRTTFESHGQNTGMEADIFGHSFSAMGRSSQARDGWTVDGREAFAAQTYFPPEPETGLEDNFFGVVKIVDDYLPPKQAPRTIDARNLMIKKRMAKRWLVLIVVCRALSLLQPDGHWLDNLLWASHFIFIAVLLHAAAFWALDESRAFQRYLNQKPVSRTEKTTAAVQPCDPFAPTLLDKICSYALMALLSIRILGLGLTVFNRSTQEASLNGACGHNADLLSHGDGYEYCQDLGNRLNNLDWPFQALQLLPFVKDNGDNLETLASYAGWIHDGLIVVLFGVLIACGAGAPSSPLSPSPGVRKVKK